MKKLSFGSEIRQIESKLIENTSYWEREQGVNDFRETIKERDQKGWTRLLTRWSKLVLSDPTGLDSEWSETITCDLRSSPGLGPPGWSNHCIQLAPDPTLFYLRSAAVVSTYTPFAPCSFVYKPSITFLHLNVRYTAQSSINATSFSSLSRILFKQNSILLQTQKLINFNRKLYSP